MSEYGASISEPVERDGRWFVRVAFAGEVHEVAASSEAEAQRLGRNLARSFSRLVGLIGPAG
jgi:hypothetical protein